MRKTLTDSLECPSCAAKSYGVKNEKVSPMMKSVGKILIAAAVFISAFIISADYGWIKLIFFMASYIIAGGDILLKAFSNILRGRVLMKIFNEFCYDRSIFNWRVSRRCCCYAALSSRGAFSKLRC